MWSRIMSLGVLTAAICLTTPLPRKAITKGDLLQSRRPGSDEDLIAKRAETRDLEIDIRDVTTYISDVSLATKPWIKSRLLAFASSQRNELPTSGKTKAIEGPFRYAVTRDNQPYVISPVPAALRERASKINAIRVLGDVDEDTHTIKPDKIQIQVEGRWENLKSADLSEQLVCDDKNCRNCNVKCGGTCKCSKWK